MEILKSLRSRFFLSPLIFFSSIILLAHSLPPPGTIERTTKQQLLASLPPFAHETIPASSSQFFLTSPSGKYSIFLLRHETSLGAGGFGSDFCYLQVQDSGVSVWESECTPVSNVNTCSLLFSEAGLEIFDGSNSAWDNDVDGENLETLVLMDSGDMQIRDKDGELVWKASDNPIVNQNCGSIGAPDMAPDHPTFGTPLHDDRGPFGQPIDTSQGQQPHLGSTAHPQLSTPQPDLGPSQEHQQEQEQGSTNVQKTLGIPKEQDTPAPYGTPTPEDKGPLSSLNQPIPIGVTNHQQPLIDNTPFDSGSLREKPLEFRVTLIFLVSFMAYFLG